MAAGRNDRGEYTQRVSDDDVVGAIETVDGPVATTAEVAEQLSIGTRHVRERLDDLHARGRVERKDVGARAAVWWLPPNQNPQRGGRGSRTRRKRGPKRRRWYHGKR